MTVNSVIIFYHGSNDTGRKKKRRFATRPIFMRHKLPYNIVLTGFIALLCLTCTSTNKNNSKASLAAGSFTPLQLEPVFEFTESEEVAFQQISSIKTDHHGNIIVRDFSQPFLFMLDRDGNFLTKIGREGNGPGEFQQIISFMVDQATLWAIDAGSKKIEKFEYQDDEYVHLTSISLEKEELAGKFIGKTKEGILIANLPSITLNSPDNPTEQPISLINGNGDILRDSIFTVPIYEHLTLKGSGMTLGINKIFGNRSLLAFDGSGRIYTLWTDSLAIDAYTPEGDRRRAFSHSLEPARVTEAERDSVLNRYDPVRADLRRKLPDVKPAVNNLLIDDRQRIWVELLTENPGHGWFCFTKEGKPLYQIEIPTEGAELREISGNRVFWNYQNEYGAPTIAVSKFDIPER